jgi:hypothetical protein
MKTFWSKFRVTKKTPTPLFLHIDPRFIGLRHFDDELHLLMIQEAEKCVKQNWFDVAYTDRKLLDCMPKDSIAIWCVYELGSYLCPMYESIRPPVVPRLPMILYILSRFYPERPTIISKAFAKTAKYYVIRKGNDFSHGSIEPISLDDLFAFARLIVN